MVKAIFFDAGGTLIEVRGGVGKVYSDIAGHYGAQLDPAKLNADFRSAFARQPKTLAPGSARQWWLEVVRQAVGGSLPTDKLQPYFEELYEFFRSSRAWLVYPEVSPTLSELKDHGFRLGIISNFDSRLRDVLVNLGIGSFFEQVTLSWETGVAKPDPKIFALALDRMGLSGSEALHLGDSIEDDIKAAQQAGLRAVLVDRKRAHSGWTACPVIHDLTGLSQFL